MPSEHGCLSAKLAEQRERTKRRDVEGKDGVNATGRGEIKILMYRKTWKTCRKREAKGQRDVSEFD